MAIKLEQFVKLMQMTTSTNDNEALIAIRKANAMLLSERKNWEDLITGLVKVEREVQQPRTATPPWADSDVSIDELFEQAFKKVRKESSFYSVIENIHQWWEDKGFLTDKQRAVIEKAAGVR